MADFKQNKRLKKFIEEALGISPVEFSKRLNDPKAVKTYNILSERNGISNKMLDEIANVYPELNRSWLLTGEGNMLNYMAENKHNYKEEFPCELHVIPLLPTAATGGSFSDFLVSVNNSDCERIVSPIKGADFAIAVAGESMAPEYPSGSQILIKKINEKIFIEWGKVYVLDTENGIILKKLMPGPKANIVKCVSINPAYPPFEVNLGNDKVFGIYRVLMCMSIK